MRLAYIINSTEGGGAAFPVPNLLRHVRACGHDVTVLALTRRDGRAIAPIEAAGIALRICPAGPADHAQAALWLDHCLSELRPSHLWTSLTRATLLGQAMGLRHRLPVASWQHSAALKPANRRLLRVTQGLSRLWLADSRSVEAILGPFLGIPAERRLVWPLFIANRQQPRARGWQPGETVRIASVGRLHPVKNYDRLIAALGRLRAQPGLTPFSLTIAGDGPAYDALTAQIAAAGLSDCVTLPGFVEDTERFLADQHLYVQPSQREGLCLAAHEAMTAGLCVVASRVGEPAFTIENDVSGVLVPPDDTDALAEALAALLRDPAHMASMGAHAREAVLQRFSPQAFHIAGDRFLQRFEDVGRTA
ncbi:lipopolysaccharide glycosyl transferase [Ameyamaea chiangmaiensis NBRC 103196]|uniref:Glycosyltransferase n=1 Tax=Ameyamaea chiangmaiensis TaxID=442969 RepID=A0A850PAX5_9PROT|nr:glycosyltransferase [Ameyamaea chiangmaiensis]MBS4076233.1 glycosyltransferase [Ameyamaea chiangmaiensis]NVN39690.1 glycosyltransferase [Ameyamaea chiangmaiensis]GBQ64655.1 lipopolysaccharide glycosyl transferase [Ameyamaea chiangmaiensis NBRC 103196]